MEKLEMIINLLSLIPLAILMYFIIKTVIEENKNNKIYMKKQQYLIDIQIKNEKLQNETLKNELKNIKNKGKLIDTIMRGEII